MPTRRFPLTLAASFSLLAFTPQLNAQLLAYESFTPADGSDSGPLIGTPTLSTGFAGPWTRSNTDDGNWLSWLYLYPTNGPGTGPWTPGLLSSNHALTGSWTNASVARRVDLTQPAFAPFRSPEPTPTGIPDFGKIGTTVWVGLKFRSATAANPIDPATWDGHSRLTFHDAADTTASPQDALTITLGQTQGLRIGAGATTYQVPFDPWNVPDYFAIQLNYEPNVTHLSLYSFPPKVDEFYVPQPSFTADFPATDPNSTAGLLHWNALTFTPSLGGNLYQDYGRAVQGHIGDLRIGGSYADVAPLDGTVTFPTAPTWHTGTSGNFDDPANWTNGVPTGPRSVAIFGPSPTPTTITLNTDSPIQRLRFDSDTPYRITGTGSLAVMSASLTASTTGARLFDVRKGRHSIEIPVTGHASDNEFRLAANTFLSIKSLQGGNDLVTGPGELSIEEPSTFERLTLRDSASVTFHSNSPQLPAVDNTYITFGWPTADIDTSSTLRIIAPGQPRALTLAARMFSATITGHIIIPPPTSPNSGPLILQFDYMPDFAPDPATGITTGQIDLTSNTLYLGREWGLDRNWTTAFFHAAYHEGLWNGPGIISSLAGPNGPTGAETLAAVFYTDSPLVYGNAALAVIYTYLGDTNLDGIVDSTDLANLQQGLASNGTLTGWTHGDFNYDGLVDTTDLSLFTQGLTNQTTPLGLSALLPDPTPLPLLLTPLLLRPTRPRRPAT